MIGGSTFVASEHISGSHGMSHSFLLLWFEFVTLDTWTAVEEQHVFTKSQQQSCQDIPDDATWGCLRWGAP